jgi:hypothetical protein
MDALTDDGFFLAYYDIEDYDFRSGLKELKVLDN